MLRLNVINREHGMSFEKRLAPESLDQGMGLLGRHPVCDLILRDPKVSRVHSVIEFQKEYYFYTDLGGPEGSQINGKGTPVNERIFLHLNDVICIGDFILLVKEVEMGLKNTIDRWPDDNTDKQNSFPGLLLLTEAEVKQQGGYPLSASEFIYQGTRLERGVSISKQSRQQAMWICQAEVDAQQFSLWQMTIQRPDKRLLY